MGEDAVLVSGGFLLSSPSCPEFSHHFSRHLGLLKKYVEKVSFFLHTLLMQ
jgi:hypothetical protein